MGSSGHQPPSIQIVPSPTTVAGPGSDAFPLSARAGEPPNTDAAAAGDVDSAAHKRPAGQPLMPLAIPNGFVPALGPLGRPEHLPPLVLGPSSSYLRSPTFPSGGSSPPVSTASEPVNAFRFHARPSSDGESSPSSNTESPNTASSHNSTMQRHRSLTLLSSPSSSSSSLMVQNNVERAVSLTSMTPSISQPAKHIPPGPESPSVPSPDGVQDLTMMGKYLVQRTVGVGTFSKVKLGEDTETGQPVAIKVVPLKLLSSEAMRASWDREIAVLKAISPHTRCVSLLDTVELDDCWCLVMEYVPGGELFDWVAKEQSLSGTGIPESEARRIFGEILEGVDYLHARNVTHRDLKLENILLTSPPHLTSLAPSQSESIDTPPRSSSAEPPHIKIADFGLSRFFEPGVRLTTRCGSEEYAAPEMILGQEYDPRGVDIWACGVILFSLLTGQLPFQLTGNQKPKSLYAKICRADFRFPDERPRVQTRLSSEVDDPGVGGGEASRPPPKVSELAKDIVRKILAPNPVRRLTSQGIWQHPWMAGLAGLGSNERLALGPEGSMLSRSSSSMSGRSSLSRGSSSLLTPATTPVWPTMGMSNSPFPGTPLQQDA